MDFKLIIQVPCDTNIRTDEIEDVVNEFENLFKYTFLSGVADDCEIELNQQVTVIDSVEVVLHNYIITGECGDVKDVKKAMKKFSKVINGSYFIKHFMVTLNGKYI